MNQPPPRPPPSLTSAFPPPSPLSHGHTHTLGAEEHINAQPGADGSGGLAAHSSEAWGRDHVTHSSEAWGRDHVTHSSEAWGRDQLTCHLSLKP
jgi:hypothetical protein